MKKVITFLLAFVLTAPLFAGESMLSEEKNVIKVNPITLIFGSGSILYERKINNNFSGLIGGAFYSRNLLGLKYTGVTITPEARFYLKEKAIDGVYVGPYLRGSVYNFSADNSDDEARFTAYGGGFVMGRQWIFNSGFTMDLFFGGHYSEGTLTTNNNTDEDWNLDLFKGFKPRLGFAIGFAF